MLRYVSLLLLLVAAAAAHPPVVPKNSAKPVGPYSPGMGAGAFLYVSGQGARDAAGKLPEGIPAQARQCLNNVKDILEAGGLTTRHVVAVQLYLASLANLPEVDKVYKEFFPEELPARVVVGVTRLPTGTPIEITVVALKDLTRKKVTPAGVWAGDRIYLNPVSAPTFAVAWRELMRTFTVAGLNRKSLVFENTYALAKTTDAEIRVATLPEGAKSSVFAVAAKKPGEVLRTGCREDSGTLFCEVRPSSGQGSIEDQTKELFAKLKERLDAHGFKLEDIVATNVWMNNLDDFQRMNAVYATYFGSAPPTRTTIQPAPTLPNAPALRISIVAVH